MSPLASRADLHYIGISLMDALVFNAYFWAILGLFILVYLLDIVGNALNLGALRRPVPPTLAGLYEPEEYRRSQDYLATRTRFHFLVATVDFAAVLAFWLLGGWPWLDGLVRGVAENEIVRALLLGGVLAAAKTALQLPFSIYSTFVIEERFGFNRTSPATFVADGVKGLALGGFFGGALLSLVVAIFLWAGPWAWLFGWLAVSAVSALASYLAPRLLLPLFFKFSPLEDPDLSARIREVSERASFPVRSIDVIDGSRRSSKANAFFTGFGRNRRIALFDTLMKNHEPDEIVAVVAHEIGHDRLKHINVGMALSFAQAGVIFYLLSLFVAHGPLQAAFGIAPPSLHVGLLLFSTAIAPLMEFVGIAGAWLSRRNEFAADAFAAKLVGSGAPLAEALRRLSRQSLSNLTPHPLYVALNYSHPPLAERVAALGVDRPDPGGTIS